MSGGVELVVCALTLFDISTEEFDDIKRPVTTSCYQDYVAELFVC
jgi:hypothetical protein